MRKLTFEDTELDQQLFAALYAIFNISKLGPQTLDELATASEIRRKFKAAAKNGEEANAQALILKEGKQELLFKTSEYEYLKSRVLPPNGPWSNAASEYGMIAHERLKEAPEVTA